MINFLVKVCNFLIYIKLAVGSKRAIQLRRSGYFSDGARATSGFMRRCTMAYASFLFSRWIILNPDTTSYSSPTSLSGAVRFQTGLRKGELRLHNESHGHRNAETSICRQTLGANKVLQGKAEQMS